MLVYFLLRTWHADVRAFPIHSTCHFPCKDFTAYFAWVVHVLTSSAAKHFRNKGLYGKPMLLLVCTPPFAWFSMLAANRGEGGEPRACFLHAAAQYRLSWPD